jgi:hypothetical protein
LESQEYQTPAATSRTRPTIIITTDPIEVTIIADDAVTEASLSELAVLMVNVVAAQRGLA